MLVYGFRQRKWSLCIRAGCSCWCAMDVFIAGGRATTAGLILQAERHDVGRQRQRRATDQVRKS